MRIAPLQPALRGRVAEIVSGTGVFRDEEVEVAVELFDDSHRAGDSDYQFLGAYDDDDELAGFACFGPTPDTDRTYDLYWLVVDRGAHRAGCGARLLNAVESELERRSGRLLLAETSSKSNYDAARAFYERRGFTRTATIAEFYAPSDDKVLYVKRIGGSPQEERGDTDE